MWWWSIGESSRVWAMHSVRDREAPPSLNVFKCLWLWSSHTGAYNTWAQNCLSQGLHCWYLLSSHRCKHIWGPALLLTHILDISWTVQLDLWKTVLPWLFSPLVGEFRRSGPLLEHQSFWITKAFVTVFIFSVSEVVLCFLGFHVCQPSYGEIDRRNCLPWSRNG